MEIPNKLISDSFYHLLSKRFFLILFWINPSTINVVIIGHKLNKQYHVFTDREQCISLNQKKPECCQIIHHFAHLRFKKHKSILIANNCKLCIFLDPNCSNSKKKLLTDCQTLRGVKVLALWTQSYQALAKSLFYNLYKLLNYPKQSIYPSRIHFKITERIKNLKNSKK